MPRKKSPLPADLPPRYPDLAPALAVLEQRMAEKDTQDDQTQVLQKWHTQLTKIQKEIHHLEKLEHFTTALKKKDESCEQNPDQASL
jgi:hypothetical protein